MKKGAHITTGFGTVTLADIGGDTFVKTTFGLVNVERIGGSLTVENSNGGVRAFAVHGFANVRTSFGPVGLFEILGSVDVDSQNGTVEVSGVPLRSAAGSCNHISLKTSFSPIRVHLVENGDYDLAAHTSFGKVTSEMPVTTTGEMGGESWNGKINKGGCALQLTDNNGAIEILKGFVPPPKEPEPRSKIKSKEKIK